VLRVRFST